MDPNVPQGTPEPDPQAGEGTQDDSGNESDQESFDAAYVRKLRQENAGWRKRAQEAEAKVSEHEKSQLSETEQAQARIAELEASNQALEAQARRDRLERQVATDAPKHGIVDPDAAVRLLDLDRLDVADDGTIANLDDALKDLIRDRPYLAGQRGSGGGGARPQESATSMNDIIRRAAGRH